MEYTVYLDDGHGMGTAGKRTPSIPELGGRVIRENEFNRAIKRKMKPILESKGIRVVLTAPSDNDVSLSARVRTANYDFASRKKVLGEKNVRSVFCSIHYNAYDSKFDGEDKDPSGISVFHNYGSTEGAKLANSVYNQLVKGTFQKKRGVKQSDFYVIKYTVMPAILTENGFMDNKREAMLMLNEAFQNEVAREHVDGILNYFGLSTVSNGVISGVESSTSEKLVVNGRLDKATIMALQKHFGGTVDGFLSVPSNLVRNIQRALGGLEADGLMGAKTISALQKYLGTSVDGILSVPRSSMVVELQKRLISGTFDLGKKTEQVIPKPQKPKGLEITGRLDSPTIEALQRYFKMSIIDGKISDPSNLVKEIQRKLNEGAL